MTGLEGRRDAEEATARADTLRERLLDEVAVAVEEPFDEGAQRPLREPLGEAVHGHEATGVQRIVLALLGNLVVLHLDLERPPP